MKTNKTTTILSLILLTGLTITSCKNSTTQTQEDQEGVTQITQEQEDNNKSESSAYSLEEDLSGKVQILTEEQFMQKITAIDDPKGFQYLGKTPAIVDFYADWCRPCVALSPIMEDLAEKYKGKLIIYKVNVDKAKNLATVFNIQSIPTLMFFKVNNQPGQMVGAPQKSQLERKIQEFIK